MHLAYKRWIIRVATWPVTYIAVNPDDGTPRRMPAQISYNLQAPLPFLQALFIHRIFVYVGFL